MADATVLVMGSTVITSWGRDQIRRLSEQARRRGVALIGADTPANLRAARPEELARVDEVVALDVHDPDACRAWAKTRAGIDAVLTIRELAVYATAVTARELGLPGNDPEAVHRIRNKDLCRERLRDNGFAQPITAVCRSAADAERFIAESCSARCTTGQAATSSTLWSSRPARAWNSTARSSMTSSAAPRPPSHRRMARREPSSCWPRQAGCAPCTAGTS